MSSPVVKDMFDDTQVDMPVDVVVPRGLKQEVKQEIVSEKKEEPAFTVVKKSSLTETEYEIFNTSLEAVDSFIKNYNKMDEKFTRDCQDLKLDLLDILANKFGYKTATAAKQDGLSFKLKTNHEVELLKAGEQ
tara:strand:+ start:1546 stop:1944 length:399 start_codon:yes stop_codon:yes gene_type:complete